MPRIAKIFFHIILIAIAVVLCSSAPDASQQHFVVVNNNDQQKNGSPDNNGTLLKLTGSVLNPGLTQLAMLSTGAPDSGYGGPIPSIQITAVGSDICVFMSNSNNTAPNEISAFKYPGLTLVGNYNDSAVGTGDSPGAIVARGGYLFASYSGTAGSYMAAWQIENGCSLSLLQTLSIRTTVVSMAETPNGQTIVATCDDNLDTFSVGAGGMLTENGPYQQGLSDLGGGLDITADSQYLILPEYVDDCYPGLCYAQLEAFVINSDGSLGKGYIWGGDGSGYLGYTSGFSYGSFSPDERFFYANSGTQLTTLNFTENPINFTYTGCITTLNESGYAQAVATALPSGAGGFVYLAEYNGVAMLQVNSTTGCTTEVKGSPFTVSDPLAAIYSLAPWPPRPF